MESIEKLRSCGVRSNQIGMRFVDENELQRIADEIEAEIERDYMKLPVDADGVPIHVGDMVRFKDVQDSSTKSVIALSDYCAFMHNIIGYIVEVDCMALVHVKPRTVEDVLRELVECAEMPGEKLDDGDIEAFADEIRKMFGGDAS